MPHRLPDKPDLSSARPDDGELEHFGLGLESFGDDIESEALFFENSGDNPLNPTAKLAFSANLERSAKALVDPKEVPSWEFYPMIL